MSSQDVIRLLQSIDQAGFSLGQMRHVVVALSRMGCGAKELTGLVQYQGDPEALRGIFLGTHKVVRMENPIDGENFIEIEESLKEYLVFNDKIGVISWDPGKTWHRIKAWSDESSEMVNGFFVMDKAKESGKILLTYPVMRYLLRNKSMIPEHWGPEPVYFFGTTFNRDGYMFVKGIVLVDGVWKETEFTSLHQNSFTNNCPVALLEKD